MCGVVGFFRLGIASGDYPGLLKGMLATIQYRGPDEAGYFFDDRIGLGTVRLSIIDLLHGQQPMSTRDNRYWLAFNGEIFNYIEIRQELVKLGCVFETSSDTEVLLKALVTWGVDALTRLNGQFGFLFFDRREDKLMFARDPFGERPLFYAPHDGGYVFGSEIKSIFTVPGIKRAIDPQALSRLYQLWVSAPGETCFEGVQALPPGHYGVISGDGQIYIAPYYRLPAEEPAFTGSFEEATEAVQAALLQSVHLRLRSDVPVACYVSGGLDSSIITYLAQRENKHPVRSFSISFDDPQFDESTYQRMVADQLGTEHILVRTSLDDIATNFKDVIWHAETALFRTAPVPMYLLAKKVHAMGNKVVLTGEGADEAFLGYNIFKETLFRSQYNNYADQEARVAGLLQLYPYLQHFNEPAARSMLQFYARHLDEKVEGLFSHEVRFVNGLFATRLLEGKYGDDNGDARLAAFCKGLFPNFRDLPTLAKAQTVEFITLLAGYLLSSQGDRMTSAHSVEGRCPFLDPNVVKLGFSLPVEYRLKGASEKHILKAAYRSKLPPAVTERPKQPYRAPDAKSFFGGNRPDYLSDLMSLQGLRNNPIIKEAFAAQFIKQVASLPPEKISPREDQAFVLLISTLILQDLFVDRFDPPQTRVLEEKLVRAIDGRELATS